MDPIGSSPTISPSIPSEKFQAGTPSPYQEENFINFSRLPPELRNKIWHQALPGPRLFHLTAASTPTHPKWGRFPFSKNACFPHLADRIAMLSICRESRVIALPLYDFVTYLHPRFIVPFSLEQDVLVMDVPTLKKFIGFRSWRKSEEVDKGEGLAVKRLVVLCGETGTLGLDEERSALKQVVWNAVRYFGNLEEVFLALDDVENVNGTRGVGRELGLERSLVSDYCYRGRASFFAQGMGCCRKIPRMISLSVGLEGGEKELEEKILGMERLDKDEVTCALVWHCHDLVFSGQKCSRGEDCLGVNKIPRSPDPIIW